MNRDFSAAELVGLGFKTIAVEPDFIVVNKAPGVGFHDEQEGEQRVPGLCSRVQEAVAQISHSPSTDKSAEPETVFPVHRLDKATSGLLLFARSAKAAAQLSEAFKQKEVEKYYLALADKKPKKKQGRIVGDMAKSRRSAYRLLNSRENPAITQFYSASVCPGLRLFLLRPYSGKTHQLRVAMKSLGSPIVGDEIYTGNCHDFSRLFLHAYCLGFDLGGESYRYLAPVNTQSGEQAEGWILSAEEQQEDLALALKEYEQPWTLNWPTIKKG